MRSNDTMTTIVYRTPTNSEIYINWDSHAPISWKIGTLKALLLRAYKVCSNNNHRQEELKHLTQVFHKTNNYPLPVINRAIEEIDSGIIGRERESNIQTLYLPYKGKQADKAIRSLRNTLRTAADINMQVIYKGSKLKAAFSNKDKTSVNHSHNIVYQVCCPEENCNETYIGETARRLELRAREHTGEKSHVGQHQVKTGHRPVEMADFKVHFLLNITSLH